MSSCGQLIMAMSREGLSLSWEDTQGLKRQGALAPVVVEAAAAAAVAEASGRTRGLAQLGREAQSRSWSP
jgi:hypothetical protein